MKNKSLTKIYVLQEYLKEGKLVQSRYHFACDGQTFALIRAHDEELFEKVQIKAL